MNYLKSNQLLLAGMFLAGISNAQESVNSAGSNATGSGGNVSYSIGQMTYNEYSTASGSVAQGVQHAYEIVTLSIVESGVSISVNAFPNPTADYLTLVVSDHEKLKLSYELRDLNGKLLLVSDVLDATSVIDMQAYLPATYFIDVISSENGIIQKFQIIKN
jgi:hypothetical protein